MFNIIRPDSEPTELKVARKHNRSIPTNGKLYETIKVMTNNRCYLCEGDDKSVVIEHILAHGGDAGLKYDWNNLILGCTYCNSIKNEVIDKKERSILNPTLADENVEDIELHFDAQASEVHVDFPNKEEKSIATCALLNAIYNGYGTEMKDDGRMKIIESINTAIDNFDSNYRKYKKAQRAYDVCKSDENKDTVELRLAVLKDEIKRSRKFFMVLNCYVREKYSNIYDMIKPDNVQYGGRNA